MRPLPVLVTSAFLFPAIASAQFDQPTMFDVCKVVYVDGSRDINSLATDVERSRSYFNAICKIKASSYEDFDKQAQDLNSSGDTIWGLFKIKAHGDRSFESAKSEFDSDCGKLSDENYFHALVIQNSSRINNGLGNVFNACIKNIADYASTNRYDVFQTYAFQGGGGLRFSIYLTFTPRVQNQLLKISTISPDVVTCNYGGKDIQPGTVLESQSLKQNFPIDCTRPTNEKITFTIGADGFTTNQVTIVPWNDPIPELRERADTLAQSVSDLRAELTAVNTSAQQRLDVLTNRAGNTGIDFVSEYTYPSGNFGQMPFDFDCPPGKILVGFGILQSAAYTAVRGPPGTYDAFRAPVGYRVRCSTK